MLTHIEKVQKKMCYNKQKNSEQTSNNTQHIGTFPTGLKFCHQTNDHIDKKLTDAECH